MPSTALADKPPLPHSDAVFTPAFYAPYESAAHTALAMLCAARAQLGGDPDTLRAITYRLKTPASIRGKLLKRRLPISCASAATLHDIAGIRVVFSDVRHVYRFARLILLSPPAELVAIRDYIAAPKPSGYQSLHLVLRLPVIAAGQHWLIPVEIQLRTTSMDAWASVEHDVCYKPRIEQKL